MENQQAPAGAAMLREWRERARMTQSELAIRLGMAESSGESLVCHYEAGRRRPGVDMGSRIERLTGIQVRHWSSEAEALPTPRNEKRPAATEA